MQARTGRGYVAEHGRVLPTTTAGAVFAATGHATKVTTATAIGHIADWQIAMRARYVVIGVTGGALRLVGREWPGNNLVIGSMAVNAKNACSVIAGIIR